MKRVLPLLPWLICLCGVLQAQHPEGVEGIRMAPRANVVTYENENAIEKLRYEDSPYYLSLNADWHREEIDGHVSLSQDYEFPKEWSEYCLFVRFQAPSGYGLWIGDKLIGVSHDSKAYAEFDISAQVRYGKTARLSLRYAGDDDGALLEGAAICTPRFDAALLLKPKLNIQDYTLTTRYIAASESGVYTLDADLFNFRKKGKCYLEVEVWDPQGHQVDKIGKWVFFGKRSEVSQPLSSTIAKAQPWSAEMPKLYTAVIRLYDEGMTLEDVVGTRFGFRTVTSDDGLAVNGSLVTLKGVVVPPPPSLHTAEAVKHLRAQLMQMKQMNINAIRTLYPYEERFYELCDELGFYVVCDANLFPTSSMGQAVATDNEYSDLFSDRMRSLYGQYKNHASIVAWSLGDSPDNGVCMSAAYHTMKSLDSHRPVLYTGAQYADNTDLIVPQACGIDVLSQYLAKNQSRSLLLLSYGSAEGNNFGGMAPLWRKVVDHGRLQGGFYAAGDWATFAALPYAVELKYLYRPIDVTLTSTSIDAAEFTVTNRCDFRSLADYKLEYVICTNLKPHIVEGDVALSLKPGESKPLKLKIPKLMLYAGEELFIQFTLKQRVSTAAVPKNTLLATFQYALPADNMPRQALAEYRQEPLQIEYDSLQQVHISNESIALIFDEKTGSISSYKYKGHELLREPLRLDFIRRPTPNDRTDPNGTKQWQRYGMGQMQCEVVATSCRRIDPGTVGVDVMLRYRTEAQGDLFEVRQTCLILQSGDVLVNNDITVSEQLKSIAKVGMRVGLDTLLHEVEWFGCDIESYPDRHAAARIRQQTCPAGEFAYRYADPQESGNRTQTRWLALKNASMGVYLDLIDTLCNFSVVPLEKASEGFDVSVDYRTTGIGGAYGGMTLDEAMLVKNHRYRFTFHMRPYDCMENDAQDFRRIIYPEVKSSILEMPVIGKNRERFDGPMTITITSKEPKSEIRYTLDGSTPTEKSLLYTKPFVIQNSTVVRARVFKKGESPSFVATRQFVFDYIVGCTFAHKPNTPYNKNYTRALYDGETGDVNDLSHGWLGFSGHEMQADLELGKSITLDGVVLRFAHVPDAWVFAPAEVLVSVSSDGQNYSRPQSAVILYNAASEEMNTTQLQVIHVPLHQRDVRFVRVVAKSIPHIPAWHRAKGLNPWIMLDEIQIDEELAQ